MSAERGAAGERAGAGAGRREVRVPDELRAPLAARSTLLAIPLLVAIADRDRPAARALPGRVHEPQRARAARPGAPAALEAVRSRSRCSRSRSCSRARRSAHPRLRLAQPDQNATIVLLVDVSGSMRANDVEPTRLDAAVAAMRTFLDRLPKQFKVGLVAFSSEPEPLIAPTSDRDCAAAVDLAARAGGRHRRRRRHRHRREDAQLVAQAGRLRPQARAGRAGRDRPALRRGAEPRHPPAAPGGAHGEGGRDPHLSGLARDAERQGDVRLRRLHELGARCRPTRSR